MLESLILVLSLCIDTFVAGIAYGTDRIKIPMSSAIVINAICSLFLALSLFVGSIFKNILSLSISSNISFYLLMILGIYKLFESFSKTYINKIYHLGVPVTFKVFDFKFVLEIYSNETTADYDKSKILTPKEALYLATALSLDSVAVGFGSSLGYVRYFEVIILSLVIGMVSLLLGVILGKKFIEKVNINLSWLSGIMLIVLATIKFI